MSDNLVITIGRQCGSAGKVIGQTLAKDLGIKCYDKELLAVAAKKSYLRHMMRNQQAVSYIHW